MKINVCTIDRNCEPGRQIIYWDTEDLLLHSELEPEADTEYRCETLEDAANTAWDLWKNGWGFEWVTYSVKPEYLDNWAGDGPYAYETVALNVGEIGAICRGWETDAESIMDQLTEEE